jgi:hypothetical protein
MRRLESAIALTTSQASRGVDAIGAGGFLSVFVTHSVVIG